MDREDAAKIRPAACLFDLGGLRLDSEPLHGLAWRAAPDRFGVAPGDAQCCSSGTVADSMIPGR